MCCRRTQKTWCSLFDNAFLCHSIAGFTAWSSTRDPAQVFTLLETFYKAFDSIAARKGIFKVETMYVPNPFSVRSFDIVFKLNFRFPVEIAMWPLQGSRNRARTMLWLCADLQMSV